MTTTVHGKPVAPVLGALLLAALSYALAQTMVAPALPALAGEYDTTTAATSWLLTGYLLSASVATPLAGKLGDVHGKGRVLTVILVIFALGSVVCALADTVGVAIAGRVIQGVAGGVFPLAFGIINDELPGERRAMAIGLVSATFGIGGGIGLPLAGLIVDHADSSLLFWIGLLALPAAAAAWLFVPPSPSRANPRIDWGGAAVLSVGLASLLFGISRANAWGWTSPPVLALMLGGLAALAAFVFLEIRAANPLVDMHVMRERPVLATNITGFLVGVAMFGSFLLIPQFVQTPHAAGYGFDMSVTGAGLLMLPSAVMMLIAGPVGGSLGNRFGFRTMLAAGTLFSVSAFLVLAFAHAEKWEFAASNVLFGIGLSFAFASMANLIVGSVPPQEVGIATGINTVMRTVGGAFGAALVTALLTAETIPGTALPTESAYTTAFAASAAVGLLAFAASLAVPSPRRSGTVAVPAVAASGSTAPERIGV